MGGFRGFTKSVRIFLVSILADESGQATTEYVLILSVVLFGAISLAQIILSTVDQGILTLGSQLEKDLKTGRATLASWTN
jgi:Flp pilus assembly pilin Flp